jgi:hypothetical protein
MRLSHTGLEWSAGERTTIWVSCQPGKCGLSTEAESHQTARKLARVNW